MNVVRVRDIANINILASRHFSMASLHHAAIALVILTTFTSPTLAFSPAPVSKNFGAAAAFNGIRIGSYYVNNRHDPSSCLYASEDDTANDVSNENKLNEDDDEEEDDEVDIITQKLRRNAENGPINPIKEHDKMIKENEDEANANTSLGEIDGNNSTRASSALYSYMLANAVDPDFDPDVSVDEAYVESQFKELLSRKGEELSRLGPGIATLPLDPSSNEAISENELAKKELALQELIAEAKASGKEEWDHSDLEESSKKQSEILEKAHTLQKEIDQLHVDDCGAVLLANLGFYEAFSLQDPERMKDVWWQSPSVICIHPSHTPLVGSNAVVESFATLFENGMKAGSRVQEGGKSVASGGVFMTPTNLRGLSVRGTTASLVCDEEVYSKGHAGESISQQGGLLVNKLMTTNVFRKIGDKWKMVHRHASWHPETVAAHAAMKAEPGIVLYDDEKVSSESYTSNNNKSSRSNQSRRMALRRLNGDGISKRPSGLPSTPPSLDGLDANAVLGIPMPKEEEPKKPKGAGDDAIGKIISLSDLLGGSDKDGDKDDDKGIGDALADMLMGSGDSGSSSTTGSGTPDDPFVHRRIVKIGPDGIENLTGKMNKDANNVEDSDEGDEKNVVIDLSGKSDEEKKEVMSKFVDNVLKDAGLQDSDAQELKSSALDASVSRNTPSDDKGDLRQKCIATLRKLADNGLLSSKQKRVLLTDIITASARKETSMVEVAYDLLCTGKEDDFTGDSELDTGMEDFTEQCRVFATMGDED
eukprot:CAMPEP_0172301552 /NCGR_PEP_ID=MMETSP1058-20130122/3410_1 /TAXON_ID=83371 /ORGANISM="Detonula confervacea, Strain CCMP 353" /LENGTH=762 /DNA_ID=CAMNT_0013011697 /DNA_START=135 /DNA_END=2426 /DNA_ORIENTATION=+